jgi:hypothetical protein
VEWWWYQLQSFTCLTRVNIKYIFTPGSSYLFFLRQQYNIYRCRYSEIDFDIVKGNIWEEGPEFFAVVLSDPPPPPFSWDSVNCSPLSLSLSLHFMHWLAGGCANKWNDSQKPRTESIKLLIKAFSLSYDLAPPPPPFFNFLCVATQA